MVTAVLGSPFAGAIEVRVGAGGGVTGVTGVTMGTTVVTVSVFFVQLVIAMDNKVAQRALVNKRFFIILIFCLL